MNRSSLEFRSVVPANTRRTQVSAVFHDGTFLSRAETRFRVGAAYELEVTFWEVDNPTIADNVHPASIGGRSLMPPEAGVQSIRGEGEVVYTDLAVDVQPGKYLAVSAMNENTTYTRTMRVTVYR